MLQLWIGVIFLGLLLLPVLIIFLALYLLLVEDLKSGKKAKKRKKASRSAQPREEASVRRFRVVK